MYKEGDKFIYSDDGYSMFDKMTYKIQRREDGFVLYNITTGGIWSLPPRKVEDPKHITNEEFERLCGSVTFDKFNPIDECNYVAPNKVVVESPIKIEIVEKEDLT